jgi:hypothetical protein
MLADGLVSNAVARLPTGGNAVWCVVSTRGAVSVRDPGVARHRPTG